ncbi:MFS transporter [Nakamurella sp. GG22]
MGWYFAGLGATAAVIPAVLPGVAAAFVVPVESVLPAVPALFLGLFVGVVCAPALALRATLTSALGCGGAGQAVGLTLAGVAANPAWFIVAAGIAGAGFGVVESAATAVTRLINHAGTPRRLTLLTVIVGVTATITPIAVVLLGGIGLTRLALPVAAAVHVIALIRSRGAALPPPARSASPAAPAIPTPRTTRAVAMLGAALFFYVGAESVLAGWSAATITATLGTDPNMAALGTSGFWLLITVGRLLGTRLNKHLRASTATLACSLVAGSALALSAVLADRSTAASLSLIGIAIISCGPCYALILGVAVTTTSHRVAVTTASALVAVGAAGGAAVPLLTLTAFDARSPIAIAAMSMAAVLVLLALATQRPRLLQ